MNKSHNRKTKEMDRNKKKVSSTIKELDMQSNVEKCWYDDSEKLFHCILKNGVEWTSENGEDKWKRVLEKGVTQPASVRDVTMDFVSATALADQMSKSPWGDLPPTQQKIHQIMNAMKDLLLYKNQKYGDSAINPKGIFYKGDSTNSILIRLDDKLGRVMSNTEEKPRINDVCDIIGYCTLLLISMGVTAEDIAKFKD